MGQQPQRSRHLAGKRPLYVRWRGASILSLLFLGLLSPLMHGVAEELFPLPEAIRPNVAFWKKIFSEVDVSGGILHDTSDLSIIYEVLQSLPRNAQERQSAISGYRMYYQSILTSLAEGRRDNLSNDEARILAMFRGKDQPEMLLAATTNMRFQGGMREQFIRGIIRSANYRPEIERIFAAAGLPLELTYLPHVESSFENRALSKVGAAGIWQIMPATGRRYLTVSRGVDERLHVPTATMAAAQIFQENYEQLGTWPLAVTAYNHGLYGMKQAVETMGTTDFNVIYQYYRGPLFGFASQNFYAEFLAALDVAQNYKKYFGDIDLEDPSTFSIMARQQSSNEPDNAKTFPATQTLVMAPVEPQRHVPSVEPKQDMPLSAPASAPEPVVQQPVVVQQPIVQQVQEDRLDNREKAPSSPASFTPSSREISVRDNPVPPPLALAPFVRQSPEVVRQSPEVVEEKEPVVTSSLSRTRRLRESIVQEVQSAPPAPAIEDNKLPSPASTSRYRVQAGDTLMSIARQFQTTSTEIKDLNKLSSRHVIKPGETLVVPALTVPALATAQATPPMPEVDQAATTTKKSVEDMAPKATVGKRGTSQPPQAAPAKPPVPETPTAVATAVTTPKTANGKAETPPPTPAAKSPVSETPAVVAAAPAPSKTVTGKTPSPSLPPAPSTKPPVAETPAAIAAAATPPKATTGKATTPSLPPTPAAKPPVPETPPAVVAVATAPKATTGKAATPAPTSTPSAKPVVADTPTPALALASHPKTATGGINTAKTIPLKAAPGDTPAPITVASTSKVATAKTAPTSTEKTMVAGVVKTNPDKVVPEKTIKPIPADVVKPVAQESPKPMTVANVTKTSLSTRATMR